MGVFLPEWCLLSVLWLLACAAMASASPDATNATGVPESYGRVVGGFQPARSRHPYFVRVDHNRALHCGGVLIAPEVVLTAAHCVVGSGSYTAYVNAYNIYNTNAGTTVRSVSRAIRHPSYNTETRDFDVAVLQLSSPIPDAKTLPLNGFTDTPRPGDSMTVIGVGDRYEGGGTTIWLNEVEVKMVDPSECDADYGGNSINDFTMFCAKDPGQDSCQGDSGGPIMMKVGGVDKVVGVVSWGRGCAKSMYPGVYARVAAAKPWIDSMIEELRTEQPVPAPTPNNGFESITTLPQMTPSFETTSSHSNTCDDDVGVSFFAGVAGVVDCLWLQTNPSIIDMFCQDEAIRDTCKETCGKCSDDCDDDPFATFSVNGFRNLNCAFVRANPQVNACEPGLPAYDYCPETCNACSRRNPVPITSSPSKAPTPVPETTSPTPFPTTPLSTQSPTRNTGLRRTTSPSTSNDINAVPFSSSCDDDPDATFHVDNELGDMKCIWLAARSDWQERLCIPGHEAYSKCQETCQVCRDACDDSREKFQFNGVLRSCLWLSLRPSAQAIVCHEDHEAWTLCPETCESCADNLTFPPTRAPVACDDSKVDRFWVNDELQTQPCVWLKARPEWQDELCQPGGAAREVCPETCQTCHDRCEDRNGKFEIDGILHSCLWLSLRPEVQDRLCVQNKFVRGLCPETCDAC